MITIRPKRALLNPELQRPSALQSTPRVSTRLWLDKNENLDPEFIELAHSILQDIPALALATYPEAGETYRKLADWLQVSPDSLLLTPGSDGAIRLVFEGFVEDNDVVIHTDPTFAMYPVYSQMFGARALPITYSRVNDEPYLDPALIFDGLRNHKPKLFCLPNPDSPTGSILSKDILLEILKECEKAGTVFLMDEAYHPFYEDTMVSLTQTSRNLVVARTFAKAWGIAGLRIGYAVGHPETIGLLHKMRPMYETSTLAVEFLNRMLDHTNAMMQSVERMNAAKDYFVNAMRSMGFKVLPTSGNFVHVAFAEHGVVIHKVLNEKVYYRENFNQTCLAGYSRFTIGSMVTMTKVVKLMKQAIGVKTV